MNLNFYLVFLGLFISSIGVDQSSWTEVATSTIPVAGVARDIAPQVIPATGVDFYIDETLLLAACPVLSSISTEILRYFLEH